MLFVIKDIQTQKYFIGFNQFDKHLRKAKIYTSYKMACKVRDNTRYMERCLRIFTVNIEEGYYYNPDMEI